MNVPVNVAIYDDGPIDAAIGRATNPSMGLTALQVSGAMRCFSRMIFSEDQYLFRRPVPTFPDHA
jgi:hypothetical protein